ncbi:diguanylate cyclase [Dechloromonas sp. HYN0024]|uniref:GGDEF domain-containing protein n=1 Tax=Dechloromonas sp. HYN0024 TaxID=2231055 RepID=UPI0013C31C76|nr:GGDEF domain-containing protein [Dechloromonas sp. HYN0024]
MDFPPPQDDEPGLAARVRADQLHLLYEQSYPAVFISLIVALLLCQLIWSEVRHDLLVGWLATICLGTIMRFGLFWLHRRRRPAGLEILDWETRYAVTLMFTTLAWGLGVLLIVRESSLVYRLIEFTILLGMSAGAFLHYSARPYMVAGSMASVLLPTTVWFLFGGLPVETGLGVAALFYMIVLVRASAALSAAQSENFKLTYRLSAAKQRAEMMAHTDELTGLENRRAFFEHGQTLAAYCERNQLPLSVAMIDADHFKQINDQFGHSVGDAVLRALADQLKGSLRKSDVCGRMGGEEFAMLLPDTTLAEAQALAERFCKSYAATPVLGAGVGVSNTVSIGVASDGYDLDHLLHCADEALYLAKATGRNRVVSGANEALALA